MPHVEKRNADGFRVQTFPKGSYSVMAAGDPSTALLDMAITSLSGRPPAYSDDEAGLQLFQNRTVQYFEHLKAVNENRETEQFLLPDIESWATALQITRATIWNYRKRGEAWVTYIDRVKTVILASRKDAVSRFKMPPMAYVFDVVNNFDYYNTSEIHLTTDPKEDLQVKRDSPEVIAERHGIAVKPQLPDDLIFTEEGIENA